MKVVNNLLGCSDSLETVNFMWQRRQLRKSERMQKNKHFVFPLSSHHIFFISYCGTSYPFSITYSLTLFQVEIESRYLALYLYWWVWLSSLNSIVLWVFNFLAVSKVPIYVGQNIDFEIRWNLPFYEMICLVLSPLTKNLKIMRRLQK